MSQIFSSKNKFGLSNIMKHISFHITNRDIVKGKQADPAGCAIARAIHRNKTVKSVKVFHDTCHIQVMEKNKVKSYRAPMPVEARAFVRRFDAGLAVAPFHLAVDLTAVARRDCLAK
jgi:hypothetical protein